MGFKIFVHAIRLVIDHLGDALRIGALLYLVQFVVIGAIALLTAGRITSPSDINPRDVLYFTPIIIALIVVNLWIAVAWHRYVLLDEMPGAVVARFNGERMLAYFGRSVLLVLIAIALTVVASIIVGFIAVPLFGSIGTSRPAAIIGGLVVFLLVYVPLAIVLYRLGLVLPASAVGKPIRFGEAWSATAGTSGTIAVLALLSVFSVWLLDLPGLLFSGPLIWVRLIWQVVTGWIEVMVGVSIITTLYGHYVERRPIS
jgi:hypothetical protein